MAVAAPLHAQQVPTSEGPLCNAVARTDPPAAVKAAATQRANGTTAEGLFMQGCLAFSDGRADRAADHFEKAVAKDATKSLYFDWLGRAYGDQAQRANKLKQPFLARKTKSAFERAIQLDPDNLSARGYMVDYYQMAPGFLGGSEARASEQIEAIRARNPYTGGLIAATAQQRRKDLPGQEREYATLVKAYPDSVAPRLALLQMQITAARWADAAKTLDAALAAFPDNRSLAYASGRFAALSGQALDRGEAALRRYLTGTPAPGEPSIAGAHMRLGQILQRRGNTADARTHLQEALKLDPALKEAKESLAKLK